MAVVEWQRMVRLIGPFPRERSTVRNTLGLRTSDLLGRIQALEKQIAKLMEVHN